MFIRGLMGYLPANLLQAAMGVLTILVFTRLLTPTEFGIYALAFSVATLVHVGMFSWIEAAMARYWAAQDNDRSLADLYTTLYRAVLILSIAFVPVGALICFLAPVSSEMKIAMAIGLLGVPIRSLLNMVKVALRARGDVTRAAGLDIYFSIMVFLLGLFAAWKGMGGASPMIGLLAAPLLALPFALPIEWKRVHSGSFNREQLKQYLHYGFPISISLGMALILSSTDRFMLGWLMNEAAVGAYHASYSIANRTLDILFIWFGSAGIPALIMALEKGGMQSMRTAAVFQARTLMLISMPAAVGVALVSRPLAEVFIGPELRTASAMVTPWIAASAFLSGWLYYYFNQAFILSKRTKMLLLTMIFPAVANIGLNFILIPKLGLMGAAISTVLGYGTGIIASLIVARSVIRMPIPWKSVATCGISAAGMSAVVIALPPIGGLVELVMDAAVGTVVYGALAYILDAAGIREIARKIIFSRRQPEEVAP